MSILLILLNLAFLTWISWRVMRFQPDELQRYYWPALVFKVVAGLSLGGIYFYYYGAGDTIAYWSDGKAISMLMRTDPMQALAFFWDEQATPDFTTSLVQLAPRSLFFSKICGVIALISGDNYWVMATWLSLFSFFASWMLVVTIGSIVREAVPSAVLAFLFLPSAVFWSSGLIKESLGLAALYILVALGISAIHVHRLRMHEWLLATVSIWVGWNLKYYWMGVFLPVALAVIATSGITRWKSSLARWDVGISLLLLVIFLAIGTHVHPNFYTSRFLEVIAQNYLEFARLSEPPRIVQYVNLEPTLSSVLFNAPAALVAGLFRPFVWEAFNSLSLLASLENLALLILVLQMLFAVARLPTSPHRVLVVAALVYVVLLVTFLALSTPNFGTLSRYRIGAIPVLVFLCAGPLTPFGRWLSARRWFG